MPNIGFKILPESASIRIEEMELSFSDFQKLPPEVLEAIEELQGYKKAISEPEEHDLFTFDRKEPGDLIKADEWNRAMKEIARLRREEISSSSNLKDIRIVHGYVGQRGNPLSGEGFVVEISEDGIFTVDFIDPFKERPVVFGSIDYGALLEREIGTGRAGDPSPPSGSGVTSGRPGNPPQPPPGGGTSGRSGNPQPTGDFNIAAIIPDIGINNLAWLVISVNSKKSFKVRNISLKDPEIVMPFSFVAIGKR